MAGTKIELYEKINLQKLTKVLNCDNLLGDGNVDAIKKALYFASKKYVQGKGILQVYNQKNKVGRYKSAYQSIQGMQGDLRKYLAGEYYFDLDFVNCHPVLLKQLFVKFGLEIPKILLDYTNDRDNFMENNAFFKDKVAFIAFINNEKNRHPELKGFHRAIYIELFEKLKNDNPKIWEISQINPKDPENIKGSFMARYLQNVENNMLQILKNSLLENGYTVGALIYDGLYVDKNKQLSNEFLIQCQNHIYNYTNFQITIIQKPTETDWVPTGNGGDFQGNLDKEYNLFKRLVLRGTDQDFKDTFMHFYSDKYVVDMDMNLFDLEKNTGLWNKTMNKQISCDFSVNLVNWIDTNKKNFLGILQKELLGNDENDDENDDANDDVDLKNKTLEKNLSGVRKLFQKVMNKKVLVQDLKNDLQQNISFDNKPNLVKFRNCCYDINTNEIRKYRADDYISETLDYDFTGTVESRNKQRFKDYVFDLFEDEDLTNYVLQVLSLAISPRIETEEFWIFTGAGRNGKSKLMENISGIFGKDIAIMKASFWTQKSYNSEAPQPEIHSCRNAKFLFTMEPEASENTFYRSDLIKTYTGGDMVKTRTLNKEPISWKPKFNMVFCCNDVPKIDDNGIGIRERMNIVPFPFQFTDKPEHPNQRKSKPNCEIIFDDEMKCDAFACLVDIYNKNIRNNKTSRFLRPQQVLDQTETYFRENDEALELIDEVFEYTHNKDDKMTRKEIFELIKDKKPHEMQLSKGKILNYLRNSKNLKEYQDKERGFCGIVRRKIEEENESESECED